MGKQARKTAKKKDRELKVKEKIQKRREVLSSAAKESKKQYLLQKLIKKIERQSPNKDKLEQIRKNLEILKTLEAEYIAEQKSRDDLNEELKKEGFTSLEEKIRHMHTVARETAESAKEEVVGDQNLGTFSGSAVCGFKPNE